MSERDLITISADDLSEVLDGFGDDCPSHEQADAHRRIRAALHAHWGIEEKPEVTRPIDPRFTIRAHPEFNAYMAPTFVADNVFPVNAGDTTITFLPVHHELPLEAKGE